MILKTIAEGKLPIFIVGIPRSGTTLLASILSNHSQLDCGPETQFFRQLPKSTESILNESDWPKSATEFICSLTNGSSDVVVHKDFGCSKKEISTYLETRIPSINAMLESLTQLHANKFDKNRWVEKSPSHLLHVDKINQYYPSAPVILITRDPRDVALSITVANKKFSAYFSWAGSSFLENLVLWQTRERTCHLSLLKHKNLISITYESLLSSPELTINNICDNIEESFESAMLADLSNVKGIVTDGQKFGWHSNVGKPIDSSKVNGWKQKLSEEDKELAEIICGEGLERRGYENTVSQKKKVYAGPFTRKWLIQNEEFISFCRTNNLVIVGFDSDYFPEINDIDTLIFLGFPSISFWLTERKIKTNRLLILASITFKLIKLKISRKKIFHFQAKIDSNANRGYFAACGRVLLSLFSKKINSTSKL